MGSTAEERKELDANPTHEFGLWCYPQMHAMVLSDVMPIVNLCGTFFDQILRPSPTQIPLAMLLTPVGCNLSFTCPASLDDFPGRRFIRSQYWPPKAISLCQRQFKLCSQDFETRLGRLYGSIEWY